MTRPWLSSHLSLLQLARLSFFPAPAHISLKVGRDLPEHARPCLRLGMERGANYLVSPGDAVTRCEVVESTAIVLGSRTCSARQVPWTCLKQRSKRHRRARRKSPENESHHRSRRTPHGWPAMSPYCARPQSRTPPVGGMVDSCCLSLSPIFSLLF